MVFWKLFIKILIRQMRSPPLHVLYRHVNYKLFYIHRVFSFFSLYFFWGETIVFQYSFLRAVFHNSLDITVSFYLFFTCCWRSEVWLSSLLFGSLIQLHERLECSCNQTISLNSAVVTSSFSLYSFFVLILAFFLEMYSILVNIYFSA